MNELEYYYSTTKRLLHDLAREFGRLAQKEIQIDKDSFVLPPEIGSGTFSFTEIEDGLAILQVNCILYKDILLKRPALKGDEIYGIYINVSPNSMVFNPAQEKKLTNASWSNSIIFSSNAAPLESFASADSRFKTVFVLFSRQWAKNHYRKQNLPEHIPLMQSLIKGEPLQFTVDMTLHFINLVEDLFLLEPTEYTRNLYVAGTAKKIIAMFGYYTMIAPHNKMEKKLKYEDVIRVVNIKRNIEQMQEINAPSLMDCSKACLMNKDKFAKLFRTVFNKKFSEVVTDIKMQHAADWLMQGYTVTEVCKMVGFNNRVSFFGKIFKEVFHTTPKHYQLGAKRIKI